MTETDAGALTETELTKLLQLTAQVEYNTLLMRNNSGAMFNQYGNMVRFGLGNDSRLTNKRFKSSDLIGITPRGQFVAVEVKCPLKKPRPQSGQINFLNRMSSMGAVAMLCYSLDEFRAAMHDHGYVNLRNGG